MGCADGRADRDLPPAREPPDQQEVDDVHAGNDEHQQHGAGQDEKRRADVAHDDIRERVGPDTLVADPELGRGRVNRSLQIRARLIQREPTPDPSHEVPVEESRITESDGRFPRVGAPRKLELSWRDADDRVIDHRDAHRPAERTGRIAEQSRRQTLGQHDDRRRSGPVVLFGDEPARASPNAEHREPAARHERPAQWKVRAIHRRGRHERARVGVGRDAVNRVQTLTQVVVRLVAERVVIHPARRQCLGADEQAVLIGDRQRFQEDAVDDAEDGGCGADAERQRQDRRRRNGRRGPQRPNGVSKILGRVGTLAAPADSGRRHPTIHYPLTSH